MPISGYQLRAARSLAGLGQRELADASEVNVNTIRNMEARGDERVRVRRETMERIVAVLDEFGVQFTDEDGHWVGVRKRVPIRPAARSRRGG